MRKLDLTKILLQLGLGVFVFAALAACAISTAQAQQGVLFNDTFDTSGPTQDVNTEIGAPRQSGAFVSQFGSVSYYQQLAYWGGTNQLSNPTLNTLSNSSGAFVSLNQNFGGVFSQGGLTVEYDLNAGADAWGWMGVGQVAQEYFANANYGAPSQPGVGLITIFDSKTTGNSLYQVFHNDVVPPAEKGTLPVSIADQTFHHYKAVFTDPTDGNPFDGQGETDVTYYIQDSSLAYQQIGATQVFTGGGLPSAVVTLQSLNALSQWDNLTVTGSVAAFANPWKAADSGSWNASGSWTTGIPNGAGSIAAFLDRNNGGVVTVDLAPTVGAIVIAASGYVSYQLVPDGVHNYGITLDNSPNGVGGISTATIDVSGGTNTIGVPLVLANSNLAITIADTWAPTPTVPTGTSLTLTAGLSAGGKNVTVTCPINGNWWEFPSQRPAGSFTVNTANVTGIGTLNLNYINMHIAGVTVEAQQVTGDSAALYIEGGSLVKPGTTANPSVDVEKLDLSGGVTYTAPAGTTLKVATFSSADSTGVFILDGGTLALTATNGTGAAQVGYDPELGKLPLAHFYLGAAGGTIDTGNQWNGLNQVIENLGATAGDLTITNTGVLVIEHDNTYTSNTLITGQAMAYTASLLAFSTGDVTCTDHGKVVFEGGHGGGVVANNFSFDLPGGIGSTAIEAPDGLNFTGTITLAGGTPGDPTTYPDFVGLNGQQVTFSGKITGTNGVVLGSVLGISNKQTGSVKFAGTVSNDYAGDTVVAGQFLALGKDNSATNGLGYNTAVAVPGKLILDPTARGWAYASAVLLVPNQTTNNTEVAMNSPIYPAAALWCEFALNGNSTTIRGLSSPTTSGLNVVQNSEGLSTAVALSYYTAATTPATLTIDTKESTDKFVWAGYMADGLWYPSATGKLTLVKTGPGTQVFVPSTVWGSAYLYTGGTIVKQGVLDISALNGTFNDQQPALGIYGGFTKDGAIALEGGTLLASGMVQDTITRGSLTSGTLEAGGTTSTVLEVNKAVDIAAAVIDSGHSLSLSSGGANVIDTVTGADGALYVTGANTTLTSHSINVGSLQIGGTAPVSYITISVPPGAATAVPEPSTLVLLALAGFGALLAWRRK